MCTYLPGNRLKGERKTLLSAGGLRQARQQRWWQLSRFRALNTKLQVRFIPSYVQSLSLTRLLPLRAVETQFNLCFMLIPSQYEKHQEINTSFYTTQLAADRCFHTVTLVYPPSPRIPPVPRHPFELCVWAGRSIGRSLEVGALV